MSQQDVLDNTPWWLPDVTTGGGDGIIVRRCDAFGMESGGARHLEGGFLTAASVGPHQWRCEARADGRFRMECAHGHKGQPQWLCNGHAMMIRKRMSGVCPPCAHPPEEMAIQEAMRSARTGAIGKIARAAGGAERQAIYQATESRLWSLQADLDELVKLGIVHRCPLTLTEIS